MDVLVTGAAGSIGRAVCVGLAAQRHRVRGLDLVDAPPEAAGQVAGWHTGDCLDPAVVDPAVAGVDAVVHLAGNPSEADLASSLVSHVHTTGRLLEAMLAHDVTRIVYASSNHAVGMTRRGELADGGRPGLLGDDVPPRPDTFYGVAKVAAEALLQRYADRHGFATYALRIGSFTDRPRSRRQLATWLSAGDVVRMVTACLTAPVEPSRATGTHHVLYGISHNDRAWWHLAPGRAVGYAPVDDAEDHAGDVPDRPEDADEVGLVGGPYALPAHDRPAFDAHEAGG